MPLRLRTTGPAPAVMKLLPLLAAFTLSACGGGDSGGSPTTPTTAVATRVELTPATDTLAYGETVTLQASVFDQDGARMSGATVSWSSSAPSVVSVAGGQVQGLGVGSAVITAKSGQVSSTAQLTVEAREHALTVATAQMTPMGFAMATLPEGASALSGETVTGTLGGEAFVFGVFDARTVGFFVPQVNPATLAGRIDLNANEFATFSLQVVAAPVVTQPETVIDAQVQATRSLLDAFDASGAPESPSSANARAALAAFDARYQAMSSAERMDLARMVAANADVFGVLNLLTAPSGPNAAPWAAATAAELEHFAALVDQLVEKRQRSRTFAEACRRNGYEAAGCKDAVRLALTGGSVEVVAAKTGLIEWLKNRIRKAVTNPDGSAKEPRRTSYTAVGVRGAPGAQESNASPLKALALQEVDEGTTYTLEVDLGMRTPIAQDAGPLTPLGHAVSEFGEVWTDFDSFLASFGTIFDMAFGLGEPAPTYVSPPVEETLTLDVGSLSLGAVSDPDVSCSSGTVDGSFAVTCTTTALTERTFTYTLHYTSPWESTDYELPVKIHPVHVLSLTSGSGQTGPREKLLPQPLVVTLRDVTGAPVAGVKVQWSVTSGGGSLTAGESVTDAEGNASTTWKLGKEGTQTVQAAAVAGTGVILEDSPVQFSADLALATYLGTFSYSGVETSVSIEGISCTWQGTGSGTVTVVETALDSVTVTVSGTGDWPEGVSNTAGVTCLAETTSISYSASAKVVNGAFSMSGDGWTLTGNLTAETASGSLAVSLQEEDEIGNSSSESGQGSFTATRVPDGG